MNLYARFFLHFSKSCFVLPFFQRESQFNNICGLECSIYPELLLLGCSSRKLEELSHSFIKDIDVTPRIKQKAQVLGLCFYYEEG